MPRKHPHRGNFFIFSRYGQLHVIAADDADGQPVRNSRGTDTFPDWIT
jgi:hypothetical protein